MIGLLGSAFGVLKWLKQLALKYPLPCLLGVSLAVNGWLWIGKNTALADLAGEQEARRLDRQAYIDAQANAALKAKTARLIEEARHRQNAQIKEQEYARNLAEAQSAGAAYKQRNRLLTQATGSPSSGSGATGTGSYTPLPATGTGNAIVVSEEDFDICTVNSTKLYEAYEWAKTINLKDTVE